MYFLLTLHIEPQQLQKTNEMLWQLIKLLFGVEFMRPFFQMSRNSEMNGLFLFNKQVQPLWLSEV
jgi:hypothetical protein